MSSNFWQTNRQKGQYKNGRTLTERIDNYVTTWENRCYPDGIPDEVPDGIMRSFRAPSYKAIAMALLKNDLGLIGLGFQGRHSQYYDALVAARKANNE